jgi:hypothetical protein
MMHVVRSQKFSFSFFLISTLGFAPAWAQPTGQISGPLVAGATTVKGAVRGASRNDVQLCDIDSGLLLDLTTGSTVPTDGNGTFTAVLLYPLVVGQRIRLQQPPATPSTGAEGCPTMPGVILLGAPVTVIGLAGWGRSRVTFMTGTIISNNDQFQAQSLNQASLFVDLTAEKNWVAGGVNPDCRSAAHPDCTWSRRWLFNTYFATRLTTEPVSQQITATPPDGLATFIGSRKSALLEGGAYVPVLVTKWIWQNAPNALFVAPIAKAGFLTPTDSNTTAQPVNPQQYYKYYAWGGRLGHYTLSLDRNEAPQLIHYLDVTVGRFGNLETLVPVDGNSGMTRPVREYRVAIEGVFQIPATPLVVGFTANLGQNLAHTPRLQTANDDLRFFFGARCDLGKLLSRLPQF